MADAIQNPSTKEGPEKTLEPGNNENPGAGSGPETTKPRVLWCAMFTQRIRLRDEMQVSGESLQKHVGKEACSIVGTSCEIKSSPSDQHNWLMNWMRHVLCTGFRPHASPCRIFF